MSTETLNWRDILSDWTFKCGGDAPPADLEESVVPSVSRSNDGLFEITTISFGFSGTAPYEQQKFTANFSFSVSGLVNFYEIAVSSDDTASVSLGGKEFVKSELNKSGIAASTWSEEASAFPAVSGTFATIGGPYSLSVTITLKRLVGAQWAISEEWTESGPYEIKTAMLSFSGNARSNTQGFSWNSLPCNIDGGSWAEISVDADDEATVSVGAHSVTATLNHPATYNSGWIEEAPDAFPLSVSYRNAGGPYRLSVTVTVKRSLREVYFLSDRNTPLELEYADANFSEDKEANRKEWLENQRCCRTVFGVGELVEIRVGNFQTGGELIEGLTSVTGNATLASSGKTLLTTRFHKDETVSGELHFSDGEILPFRADIKCPKYEIAQEITEAEYLTLTEKKQSPIDYGGLPYFDGHYFAIQVCPRDVSFSGLSHWEDDCPEVKSGLFCDLPEEATEHTPAPPWVLNDYNACVDKAYYAVDFSEEKIRSAEEDEAGHVGVLVWICPVRWSFEKQPDGGVNSARLSDGTLPSRIQKMILDRAFDNSTLIVKVTKEFPSQ